jgi:hypothetical protein
MPRKAPKPIEPDDEIEVTDRDFVMARLAAGRTAAQDALHAIDEALGLFLSPDDDKKGKERKECITTALEALGVAARALECAEENADEYDPEEGEPWDVEDDDEDDEDEDDEDDDAGD